MTERRPVRIPKDVLEDLEAVRRYVHAEVLDIPTLRYVGPEFRVTANVAEVYIAYLRKKVDAPGEPKLIRTVRGRGTP